MENRNEAYPKFCPICGHDSIEAYERAAAVPLYRCATGHYFLFTALENKKPPSSMHYD
jgi:hypothetical protein